jgi:acyl-CoA synthetase (AMP-forming)/AMP-acid ligase II
MTALTTLLQQFKLRKNNHVFMMKDRTVTYDDLSVMVQEAEEIIRQKRFQNRVVALCADYSPEATAWLLALWKANNIVVLLSNKTEAQQMQMKQITEVQACVSIKDNNVECWVEREEDCQHPLLQKLIQEKCAGFVLFSSGSTGEPKAILHRAEPFLRQHVAQENKPALRVLAFLLFDHIGGLNVLLSVLSRGGCVVVVGNRNPFTIGERIEHCYVQAMTVSPSFLNLLLLSGALNQYDFSSLDIVNYGTEPMPESTLEALQQALPHTRFSQAYGLSEVGIIPTRSKDSHSLWMKIGNEDCLMRVNNGLLEIKSPASMVGYLNADNIHTLTEDGWFITGDAVIQEGEFFRVVGRQSDLINIGGEKIYPIEVENVLKTMPQVLDVAISSEPHFLLGNLMIGRFQVDKAISLSDFKKELMAFAVSRLRPFQIPRKIFITQEALYNERFKKIRRA